MHTIEMRIPGSSGRGFQSDPATGNYHRVLMYYLGVAGFDLKLVSSVSSVALACTREAPHNNWDKNDPKDAQVILHMLQIGAVQIF